MPIKQKDTANGMRAELANVVVGTVLDNLTAAGTNQATALVLTLDDAHVFRTVGSGTGAIFQYLLGDRKVYAPGDYITISNFGVSVLSVYPASGGSIENGATNTPFTFGPNTSAFFQSIDGLSWIAGFLPGTGGGGLGTVTSVGQTVPVEFIITGSPITTSGTLAITKATESANTVWAGPTTGSAAQPTFRAIVPADLPLTSSTQFGAAKVDNTTITASSGVITAVIPTNQKIAAITFIIDGGGSAITAATKGYVQVPFACTITESTLLADQSGSIVVNLWKCTYSQFDAGSTHPVTGDKINSSTPPTISSATKADDTTLSGWTTSISAGDIIGYNVSSASAVTRVTSTLKVSKT